MNQELFIVCLLIFLDVAAALVLINMSMSHVNLEDQHNYLSAK